MKTNGFITAVVAFVAAAFLLSSGGNQAQAAASTGTYNGTITSLELKTRTLKVKSESSSMAFYVPREATIIVRQDEKAQLSDLTVGDKVRVDYAEQNGIYVAAEIELNEKEPPTPPESPVLRHQF